MNMRNFIEKYWTAQNHEVFLEKIMIREGNEWLHTPEEKVCFSDFLYFCFLALLILDRTPILPSAGFFQVFPYQLIEAVLLFFMFVVYRKIYVPNRILFAYLPVFIQSGLIILSGRVEKSVIVKENIQLMLLIILSVLIYNYGIKKWGRLIFFIEKAYLVWIGAALLLLAFYWGFGIDFGVLIDRYFPYPRLIGLSGDPNVLGIYILTFLPIVLYQKHARLRIKILLLIITFAMILLTFSRANIVVLIAFIPAYIYVGMVNKLLRKKEVLCIFIFIVLIVAVLLSVPDFREPVLLRFSQFKNESNIHSDSRFGLWIKGLKLFIEHPIFGVGMDHCEIHIHYFIHNTFIEWVASCGIFSFFVIRLYISNCIRHFRRCKESILDFYLFAAYFLHLFTLSFVSLLNFEPTFILLAISETHFRRTGARNEECKRTVQTGGG